MVNALLLPFLAILLLQLGLFVCRVPSGRREVPPGRIVLMGRLRLVGLAALAAGLAGAAVVYRNTALDPPGIEGTVIGYEVGSGYSYPITTRMTKKGEVGMEQIGGKANVAVAEFREWFGTLWHGRKLAYTLAALSTAGCLGCFFVARLLEG